MTKLFNFTDFQSVYTERQNDYQDMADIANAKVQLLLEQCEKLREITNSSVKYLNCSEQCKSNDSWAMKCLLRLMND